MIALVLVAAPAHAADDSPICADRPSKSTGECTVPAGRWQVETGLIDWSRDESDGIRTDSTALGSTLLKLGISGNADVELGLTPYEISRVHGPGGTDRHSGFGDVSARIKYRLTAADTDFQAALDPFVKIPTAGHNFGNGKVEGGLVVPLSLSLGRSGIVLSLDPEIDWLADGDGDGDGDGYHPATVQVFNVGASLTKQLSISGELWGAWDWDHAGTVRQYSVDGSVAYLLGESVQLDGGANFGLNRNTPDVELYAGLSKRF